MKIRTITALLGFSLIGALSAEPKEPYKAPKKVNISPHIPMGGVAQLTESQYEKNKKDLETIKEALAELASSTEEGTKADKDQEALLKEREAYLSFIVKSYDSYHELKDECEND